jgi:gliding motility-associated-like protein
VNRCLLFLLLLLGAGLTSGLAQGPCAPTGQAPPPCNGVPFHAIDVATNTRVQTLCVGRTVRFELCPGRNILATQLYYQVNRGSQAFPIGCTDFNGNNLVNTYRYTPTLADVGTVTVSELTNPGMGAPTTFYYLEFLVKATPTPQFTVFRCPANSVLVRITDTAYDDYFLQLDTSTQPFHVVTHQDTVIGLPPGTSGVFPIILTGHYRNGGLCTGSQTIQVPVLSPPQTPVPVLTSLSLLGPTATFTGDAPAAGYRSYLQLADAGAPNGFRTLGQVPVGSASFTQSSPVPGCYRVLTSDYCSFREESSEVICTINLQVDSRAGHNRLHLNTSSPSTTTYSVTRNGAAFTNFVVYPDSLVDTTAVCGSRYTYRVTGRRPSAVNTGTLLTSVSDTAGVLTASARPPRAPRLVASFNLRNVVELRTTLAGGGAIPAGSTLNYRRSAGSNPPTDFGSSTSNQVRRDSLALADFFRDLPCYTVQLVDVCRNTSPDSRPSCPALLEATATDAEGNTINLSWRPFSGPDPGTPGLYQLERLQADGRVLDTTPIPGNSYTDLLPPPERQVLRYRLKISGAGIPAGSFSYSNVATVTRRARVVIPTAFTPNGDGLNDILEIKGRFLKDYTFIVVDRNGQEVFRSRQRSDTWDGRINGQAPVNGTYVWRFEQNDEEGKLLRETGSITILK